MLTQEICEAVLRDHFKNPRHYGVADCECVCRAENPACGDIIDLGLKTGGLEWKYEGKGCAASQAGMSLVLMKLQEGALSRAQMLNWIANFKKELFEGQMNPEVGYEFYEDAAALFVFRSIPSRLNCVCLGVNLLEEELKKRNGL